jgi:hypothetical protein
MEFTLVKFGQPNYGGGSADICPWRGQGHQLLHTLQNHCCFELGEKLSKNDSAKTNNIYIQTPGQNC